MEQDKVSYKIMTQDNVLIEDVPEEFFAINEFLQDLADRQKNEGIEIPIPFYINAKEVKQILDWVQKHEYNLEKSKVKTPVQSRNIENVCESRIDSKFIKENNLDFVSVKDLLEASVNLNIVQLQDICMCLVACYFYVGSSKEEIDEYKQRFNINDEEISEEKIKQLRKDFPWAFNTEQQQQA